MTPGLFLEKDLFSSTPTFACECSFLHFIFCCILLDYTFVGLCMLSASSFAQNKIYKVNLTHNIISTIERLKLEYLSTMQENTYPKESYFGY